MNIVVDANVLISALIRDSTTREILTKSKLKFYCPGISLRAVNKYEKLILEKSGLSNEQYCDLLNNLLKCVNLIEDYQIKSNLNLAEKIMGKIDTEDVVFIAGALSLPNSIIWSDDKHFEKQNKIRVLKTKDILKYFNL